jgi:hypothetical protein
VEMLTLFSSSFYIAFINLIGVAAGVCGVVST